LNNNEGIMTQETASFLSLREIGRRLGIPPSTVVYYKDRFARFFPVAGGAGRRRRYPTESMDLFRRIREMFEKNWSAEQIEQELAAGYSLFEPEAGGPAHAPEAEPPAGLAAALERVSDLLDQQGLFHSEVRSLREEVAALRRERAESEARQAAQVRLLEQEILELRGLLRRNSSDSLVFPPADYLDLPLVVRTGQSEYLGVLGRNSRPFRLQDFAALLEGGPVRATPPVLTWRPQGQGWILDLQDVSVGGQERRIVLETERTVTPSKNAVALVRRLAVNGQDAPDALLLSLFRQIRESFGG
jgi:DNA-binding transcriptional MerR regulator